MPQTVPISAPLLQTSAQGIYVHVPFCQSRCIYCDFYSTTGREALKDDYVTVLCREMEMRRNETEHRQVGTIYIGGGTPSTLSHKQLIRIFDALHRHFDISPQAEVTLEANPDDVTPQFCALLRQLGVNRVSLGVQTFSDERLKFLCRRHSAVEAEKAVWQLHRAGIENLTIDLIYGLPDETLKDWQSDVERASSLPIKHLSAYALMYEEGTRLTALRDHGKIHETSDDLSLAMFEHLIDATASAGMTHYEISNFALPHYHSRHNSAYWTGTPYIGLGPGAHSYDGRCTRRSNHADLAAYITAEDGYVPHDVESLSEAERCDERVFTALRTCEGLDLEALQRDFGTERTMAVRLAAAPHLRSGLLQESNGHLLLTRRGIFLSNLVMSDLMQDF